VQRNVRSRRQPSPLILLRKQPIRRLNFAGVPTFRPCSPFAGGGANTCTAGADYVCQRTDGRAQWAHDSLGHWAHDLRNRQGGEICIESGETTFFVDELPILSTRGNRWLRAIAAGSALDASRQKI